MLSERGDMLLDFATARLENLGVDVLSRTRPMIFDDAGRVVQALYVHPSSPSSCNVSIADEASMARGLATRLSLLQTNGHVAILI
jgi:hypothetical protein